MGFYCKRKANLAGVGRQEGMQGPRVRLWCGCTPGWPKRATNPDLESIKASFINHFGSFFSSIFPKTIIVSHHYCLSGQALVSRQLASKRWPIHQKKLSWPHLGLMDPSDGVSFLDWQAAQGATGCIICPGLTGVISPTSCRTEAC